MQETGFEWTNVAKNLYHLFLDVPLLPPTGNQRGLQCLSYPPPFSPQENHQQDGRSWECATGLKQSRKISCQAGDLKLVLPEPSMTSKFYIPSSPHLTWWQQMGVCVCACMYVFVCAPNGLGWRWLGMARFPNSLLARRTWGNFQHDSSSAEMIQAVRKGDIERVPAGNKFRFCRQPMLYKTQTGTRAKTLEERGKDREWTHTGKKYTIFMEKKQTPLLNISSAAGRGC